MNIIGIIMVVIIIMPISQNFNSGNTRVEIKDLKLKNNKILYVGIAMG